ncbi:MAG: ATP-binding protein, partial [Anaerolineales bacterium]
QSTSNIQLILCPQCEHPLPGDARTCPNCGIDLALLSLLGEKAYLDGIPKYAPMDTTPQWLVPRIGDFLIKQGEITDEQLKIALSRQKKAAESGEHVLLGQTLLKLGYLERETLDRAITQQIVELHAALQESNRTLQQRVTERTKELRHALERLTEINQIKANLISNISHELRTPLAHIKGYVELFVAGQLGDLSEEQSEAMQVTLRATKRLESLIEDLIEFSTASREGITLHLQPVSIPELIDGVLDRSREKAKKAGVALETKLENNLPDFQVDPERLSWAIFQLVDNGIKFTPDGGKVNVQVGIDDLGIHFSVSDTGIGIPEDRIQEIFEPFHQLDGSPTRRYGGAGLGLALVKIIVDAHGSELSVESQEGQGTKFVFTIPSASGNK